jgi:RimJ/RimL family protein N-acetyltransferase
MVSDHVVTPLGKEIVMRPFSATDAEVLVSWATSADELLQWAGPNFTYPLDRQQLARYAASADHNHHLISAVARESGAVVGHAELNLLPQHELGRIQRVAVAPQWRSRGIGQKLLRWLVSFGFDELGLHRLELLVFSFNEAALRCYRSVGFREEGFARHARKASTGYWDLIYMGLLDSWYRELSSGSSEGERTSTGV